MTSRLREELARLLQFRTGHFLLESGHHGQCWLDLEVLCHRPDRIQPLAVELANRLRTYGVDAVCGPLVEGAFIAILVARELEVEFLYTEPSIRTARTVSDELFPVTYHLPRGLKQRVSGKRVAIVNDVINAGSAVRGTLTALKSACARTAVVATMLTLGDAPQELANEWNVDLVKIDSQSNSIWTPRECPMCAQGIPLDNHRS